MAAGSASMSWSERLAQLGALWTGQEPEQVAEFTDEGFVASLGRRLPHGTGGLTRPFGTGASPLPATAARVAAVQAWLVGRGLPPALVHEECLTGLMAPGGTVTPSPLAVAASFDPSVAADLGDLVGGELAACGVHQGLAPVLDVARDQRWGRVEETYGEDPYLVALLGAAWIRGLQSHGVAATGKHFVAHGACTGGRNTAAVAVGPATLSTVHLPPWRAAIASGLRCVMTAYHGLDDVPVHADPAVVTRLLRERLGFDGLVVSDYWAMNDLVTAHRTSPDTAAAARAALLAGVDMELPRADCLLSLAAAVEVAGGPDADLAAAVERHVERVLATKADAGLLDGSVPPVASCRLPSGAGERVRDAAARGLVLLVNDGTLPLVLRPDLRVVVLGPHADDPRVLAGNYAWANHVGYADYGADAVRPVPPQTIAAALAEAVVEVAGPGSVVVAPGCAGLDRGGHGGGDDEELLNAAVEGARGSDVAVVVAGDLPGHFGRGTVGEGSDRTSLRLPGGQERLVRAVAATGTPVVLVLACGRAVDLTDVERHVAAVLVAWFAGDGGARAVADALLGVRAPAGRLPVTFAPAGCQPLSYDHPARAGVPYRGDHVPEPVVHWFGSGLTYATFARRLWSHDATAATQGAVRVEVDVTNTSDRDGEDVVQVYGRRSVAAYAQPEHGRLVAFARVPVAAGATVRVSFGIDVTSFADVDPDGRRVVRPGRVELRVADHGYDPGLPFAVEFVGPDVTVADAVPPRESVREVGAVPR